MEPSPTPEAGDVADASAPALPSVEAPAAPPVEASAPAEAPAAPAPSSPAQAAAPPAPAPGPELRSPEAWAASKETPAWQLEVTRAFHLASTDNALRVPWLPNGQLPEAAFDKALDRALNASLR